MANSLSTRGQTSLEAANSLRAEMDRLFQSFFGGSTALRNDIDVASGGLPRADIVEDDTGYRITLELPGIEQKDLDVTVRANTLTVRAEQQREEERQDQRRNVHLRERSQGSIQRTFRLGEDVDSERVEAQLRNGLLTLNLPKTQKSEQRRIEIKSST